MTLNFGEPEAIAAKRGRAPDRNDEPPSQPKPANDNKTTDWLFELNQQYAVVNEEGKVLVHRRWFDPNLKRHRDQWLAFDDFKRMFDNQSVRSGTDKEGNPTYKRKGTAWLKHKLRRQYDGVVFMPDGKCPPNVLNLWQGFGVTSKPGDWSKLRDHIRDVICAGNEEHFDYFMNWLARAVQVPGEAGEVGVVLRGTEGLGKGILVRSVGRLFGDYFLHAQKPEDLIGKFNGELETAVLVFADEATFAGDKRQDGILKARITEPTMLIENKFRAKKQVRNVGHIIFASNEKWVVPAGPDARRYFILDVANKHKGDHKYFEGIQKQLDAGGYAAMLHELQHRDISKFNHSASSANRCTDRPEAPQFARD